VKLTPRQVEDWFDELCEVLESHHLLPSNPSPKALLKVRREFIGELDLRQMLGSAEATPAPAPTPTPLPIHQPEMKPILLIVQDGEVLVDFGNAA
jgi:hypothetical protein